MMLSTWVRPRGATIRDVVGCPACPSMPVPVVAGGAVAGGLLMYIVGLATREKRRKNPRRRAGR
jgi:hypothetical protein